MQVLSFFFIEITLCKFHYFIPCNFKSQVNKSKHLTFFNLTKKSLSNLCSIISIMFYYIISENQTDTFESVILENAINERLQE